MVAKQWHGWYYLNNILSVRNTLNNVDELKLSKPLFSFSWRIFFILLGIAGIFGSAYFTKFAKFSLLASTKFVFLWLLISFTGGVIPNFIKLMNVFFKRIKSYDNLYQSYVDEIKNSDEVNKKIEKFKNDVPKNVAKIALEHIKKYKSNFIASMKIYRIKDVIKKLKPLGVTNRDGTVNLVINGGRNMGLDTGMHLSVRTKAGNDLRGVVEIQKVFEKQSHAVPVDRANPEFWENLEDRVNHDSSPPTDIYFKPRMVKAVRKFFDEQSKKEEQIDID